MPTAVPELERIDPARFDADVVAPFRPVVLRGLAADWPAVVAAWRSDEAVVDYLATLDSGRPAQLFVGPPEIEGRFFYDSALAGCNFQTRAAPLGALMRHLLATRGQAKVDALYAGAAATDEHLPDWSARNPLPFDLPTARARVWVGNRTDVATHFDEASNIAVVVAGRRRFTLFPPEQADNLYVGPLHLTIAGPPVSMVDCERPDLDAYPRFAEAQRHALVAELGPGDAIYIPPIWWHDVRALAPFNVMVNHWWEDADAVSPLDAFKRTLRAVRDLPLPYRAAWRHWFERFVFDDDAPQAADHLPDHARGLVGPPSPMRDAFLREQDQRGKAG
ncbi:MULTISPECIES: cupin-like domain-containing protein [unclassified Sphingomonas]|uniref:cupin-like domain-containing protein n=1 Tax=unclassified Sphingomonas TaxID=196159 RepID=UPI00226A72E8|nr:MULTISPECIES: cupin-like domain-containing protein [unclassified Sphingomonas]